MRRRASSSAIFLLSLRSLSSSSRMRLRSSSTYSHTRELCHCFLLNQGLALVKSPCNAFKHGCQALPALTSALALRSAAMSCTLSRCSLGADLYISSSSFISFWLSWAFLEECEGGLVSKAVSHMTGTRQGLDRDKRRQQQGPHLSSPRRPLSSSDSFLLTSSTLAFSRSALERAEATGRGPRLGPSRSRSSRLGLVSGSRAREEGPWVPGVRDWASSSEGTSSSFFTEEVVVVAPGTNAISFLLSGITTGPGPLSSLPGAGVPRPESSGWPRLGMEWVEPLAWARSYKDRKRNVSQYLTGVYPKLF